MCSRVQCVRSESLCVGACVLRACVRVCVCVCVRVLCVALHPSPHTTPQATSKEKYDVTRNPGLAGSLRASQGLWALAAAATVVGALYSRARL